MIPLSISQMLHLHGKIQFKNFIKTSLFSNFFKIDFKDHFTKKEEIVIIILLIQHNEMYYID